MNQTGNHFIFQILQNQHRFRSAKQWNQWTLADGNVTERPPPPRQMTLLTRSYTFASNSLNGKTVCCMMLTEHGSAHERRQEVRFKDRKDSCAALLESQGLSRTDSLTCPHTGHITPVQSERRCPSKRSAIQLSNTIAQTVAGHEKTFHLLTFPFLSGFSFASQCSTVPPWPSRAPAAWTPCPTWNCNSWRQS